MSHVVSRFIVAGVLAIAMVGTMTSTVRSAEDTSLSVTVTPPLIQLTIGPGEEWTSSLKVVNNNPYEVTYYALPVDFDAAGEGGTGTFMPVVSGLGSTTLGTWIEITKDPIIVSRGASADIPLTIRIPADASPGGKYAAILVGTNPDEGVVDGPSVRVASYVSTLLFVRIKGEIDERARIREFRSEYTLYQDPRAQFVLRFENLGNTHLRPEGEIVIYNMWGKERGRVQLNQRSAFGNVLPSSTRRFSFVWEGEASLFDIGRYRAVATISYGEDEKQNTSATNYFWLVPVVPVVGTFGSIVLFIMLMTWIIRRYIRRTLSRERELLGGYKEGSRVFHDNEHYRTVSPLVPPTPQRSDTHSIFGFLQAHSLLFFFCALVAAGVFVVWMYVDAVLVSERSFDIQHISSDEEK